MGAAKGEPQDEEVPTPTKDAMGEATAEGDKQRSFVYILLLTYCFEFLKRVNLGRIFNPGFKYLVRYMKFLCNCNFL